MPRSALGPQNGPTTVAHRMASPARCFSAAASSRTRSKGALGYSSGFSASYSASVSTSGAPWRAGLGAASEMGSIQNCMSRSNPSARLIRSH